MSAEQICREAFGRRVREIWIAWAKEQPTPKPSWLVPWEQLSEPDKGVDRRIGETIAREYAAQIIAESGVREALTLAKGDIQFWIEHNRDGENPMGEIGRSMLKTRAVLDAALANLTASP